MAPNVYFRFHQYENFAAIIIGTEIKELISAYLLSSDTVPLNENIEGYSQKSIC